MKFFIFLFVLVSLLYSKTYNFTETRYSDALDKERKLKGSIDFFDNGLHILYKNSGVELLYKNGEFTYMQDGKEKVMDKNEHLYIAGFFRIISLIHKNDFKLLADKFVIQDNGEIMILSPKGEEKEFIQEIKILKQLQLAPKITLYLTNGDFIDIGIGDEI